MHSDIDCIDLYAHTHTYTPIATWKLVSSTRRYLVSYIRLVSPPNIDDGHNRL